MFFGEERFGRTTVVLEEFLESLSLCRAAGNGGNFGPIAAFLFFMNYDFDFHCSTLRGSP